MLNVMSADEQFDQVPALPEAASQVGSAIADNCRAARIEEVTDFAQCQGNVDESCPHRFVVGTFYYCVHPQREAIIARTRTD
ncbi:MAG: hypothetical protein NT154_32215 [Verrucomicrobia bacterium]|nr:hypothetical protein [Verrucomicrobiota bacterium]